MQTLPPSGRCSPQPRLRKPSIGVLATYTEQTSDAVLKPSEGWFRARFEVTFPNAGAGRGTNQQPRLWPTPAEQEGGGARRFPRTSQHFNNRGRGATTLMSAHYRYITAN